ncbi:2-haloacid dehalogenase [Geothermobacter ehrlichii]|uniref:2-haloacid dehalogenase n=1 Tax=Geothermobacter ehrlichii TaxID=213224 RepID=A0A5D3WM92_9BACT|nr:haloacid dehalogenase type II [Geothermobacter ehrlichii]TYO99613.1 2-haloacid dehalogenase [Geothermobacter ehrlichii]
MPTVFAFDVYGTLIDTAGVVALLERMLPARARAFSDLWRSKQLEYSFRRGLMQNYRDFSVCTAQALDYTCAALGVELSSVQKAELLAAYRRLPAFADVEKALELLRQKSCRLFAFSNGKPDDLESLLQQAGIREYFEEIVSCDEIRSFKPNPAVYAHFLRRAGAAGDTAWMVSGNPFDVLGALSAGMRAAWIRRNPDAVFDPWELSPTATLSSLEGLVDLAVD